jgi:hypothetical protein
VVSMSSTTMAAMTLSSSSRSSRHATKVTQAPRRVQHWVHRPVTGEQGRPVLEVAMPLCDEV